MNAVVVLRSGQSSALKVGDLVTLEIAIDGKTGAPGEHWTLDPPSAEWVSSGSFLLAATSLQQVEAEGEISKLHIDAVVQRPGKLSTAPFTIRNEKAHLSLEVPQALISNEEAPSATQKEKPPEWLLPPVALGGWNQVMIALVALVILAGLGYLARWIWRRIRERSLAKWNARDRALHALSGLQRFARSKRLEQDQWKKFSFDLAGILRKFSDENFGMDTRDMTDREFLSELRLHYSNQAQIDSLSQLLASIMEVRYGTKTLESEAAAKALSDAKSYVETSYVPKEGKK